MATIALFHPSCGLRPSVLAAASMLTAEGHTVRAPDLYDGRTADTMAEGLRLRDEITMPGCVERATHATADIGDGAVYIGMSLGCLAAVELAKNRNGSALVFLHDGWVEPDLPDIPVVAHAAEPDEYVDENDLTELGKSAPVYRYPGCAHLYTDAELHPGALEARAAELTWQRVAEFLRSL